MTDREMLEAASRARMRDYDVGAAETHRRETAYRSRILDLPINRMVMRVGRIGYPNEGLRLSFSMGFPHKFSTEIQLTRGDAESLIEQLRANLESPNCNNLPEGTKS